MASFEELYKYYATLTEASDKAGQYEKEFLTIIESVKGGAQEKGLASQVIARFFRFFPQHTEKAMNAQLDLCEDEDVNIRKRAIKDLPSLCKASPENLPRIADVLTQLLQTEDSGEHHMVQIALLKLMRSDIKGALQGVFTQIISGDDPVREKAIKFLSLKLKSLGDELISAKIEEFIVDESKKVLQDVTADEFLMFISILSGLKCMQTLQGRQQLVDIVSEQAGFGSEFDAEDTDSVDRVVACTQQAISMFSKNVRSTKFVAYYLDKVVSKMAVIKNPDEGEDLKLELLKQLADMSQWCLDIDSLPERLANLYTAIQEYMPVPPPDVVDMENAENKESSTPAPALQFSYVECLLFTLHQFGRKCPEFLADADNAEVTERMKDFKIRLQYFARGVASYIKQLKTDLQGKKQDAVKSNEDKVKVAAYKTTTNIQLIIKDLMHSPPSYKAHVKLSWKLASEPVRVTSKRPSTGASQPPTIAAQKVAKTVGLHMDRAVYAPPTGKYSDKAGSAPGGAGRGGHRGGRGAWRGKY